MAKQLQLCFDFLEEKEQQTEKVRKAVNILGKDRVRGDAQNPESKITTPA